jgi:hypothetical protein
MLQFLPIEFLNFDLTGLIFIPNFSFPMFPNYRCRFRFRSYRFRSRFREKNMKTKMVFVFNDRFRPFSPLATTPHEPGAKTSLAATMACT